MEQLEAGGDGEASRGLLCSRLLLFAVVATVCVRVTITNMYNSNNGNNEDAGHDNYEAVKLRVARRPCELYPGQEQRLLPLPMSEDKALAMMRRAATCIQTHLYSLSSTSSSSSSSPDNSSSPSYPRKPVPRVTLCFVHAPMSVPSLAIRHHILLSAPRISHLLLLRAAIKSEHIHRQPFHNIIHHAHATLAPIKPHHDLDNITESHILALIYTSMAHVWLWDGNGAAPPWLLTGMADFLTMAAGLNSLSDTITDLNIPNFTHDIGGYPTQRTYWAGGFLQYCEALMPGFVPALNAKLSTGWNQSFFHDLLGQSFEDLWLTYTNSSSPIDKQSADNLQLSQIG